MATTELDKLAARLGVSQPSTSKASGNSTSELDKLASRLGALSGNTSASHPVTQTTPAVPQTSVEERLAEVESELKRITNMSGTFDVSPYTQEELDTAEVRRQELEKERTQLLAEKAQTAPSMDQRIGKGAQAIGTTIAAAPRVLWDTTKQYFQNAREESQNEDRQRISTELENTLSQMHYMENYYRNFGFSSKAEAQASEKWQELNAKYQQLSQQLKGTEVNTPVSMDTKGMQMMQEAGQQREAALVGLGKTGRFVGDTLISVGQNVAMLPLAAVNPVLPALAMGVTASGSRAAELNAQGTDPGSALTRGIVSGTIESLTEKLPIDTVLDLIKTGGKDIVVNLLKQAGIEATEEGVSYALNFLADKAAKDPNATFTLSELGYAMASGGFSGLLMGGGATAINLVQTLPIAPRKAQNAFALLVGEQVAQAQEAVPAASQGQNKTASTVEPVKASSSIFNASILSNLNKARTAFIDYAKLNFPSSVVNTETGRLIGISRKGLDKFLSGRITPEKYASGFYIPQLIERATLVADATNTHEKQAQSIPTYDYYDSNIEIDGVPHTAHIRVRNTNMGDRYYGHTISVVDEIKIEPSARTSVPDIPAVQPVNAIDDSNSDTSIPDVPASVNTKPSHVEPTDSVGAAPAGFEGDTVRGFSSNLATDTARHADIQHEAQVNPQMYFQLGNAETRQKAMDIMAQGLEKAKATLHNALGAASAGKKLAPEMVPLSKMVADQLAANGDIDSAWDILSSVAVELTEAGRLGQAARILRDTSPAARAMTIQKTVDKLNKRFKKADIQVRKELMGEYMAAETDEARDAVLDEIYQNIADQIPSTFVDRLNALRYLNMLGNLRTQGRNIIGNALNMGVRTVDQKFQALMQALVYGNDPSKRTTTLTRDPALYDLAKQDFEVHKAEAMGEGKYSDYSDRGIQKAINEKRTIFKSKPLEKARVITSSMMEAGDRIFSKPAYADALARYLQAKGYTAEQWQNGEISSDVMEAAVNHAVKEAQEATFRESNAFSNLIAGIHIKNADNVPKKVANAAIQGVLPFTRTPANVLVQAERHSPLGLFNAAANAVMVKKGVEGVTGNDVIKSLSQSLSGTALMALGYILARLGVVTGGENEDEKLANLDKLQGVQEYSIVLPNGDSVTYEWATPAALPFAMGAELAAIVDGNGFSGDDAMRVLSSITDVMLNMSMLQGLNSVFEGVQYSERPLVDVFVGALVDYLTQGLTPTLFGQIERTFEDKRMTTFTDKDSAIPTDWQYRLGSASQKLPGWDFQQVPYIDAWGRTQDSGNIGTRAVENFLSPGYISSDTSTGTEEELRRLAKLGYGSAVVPKATSQSQTVTYTEGDVSKTRRLSESEYVRYATTKGQTSLDLVSDMIDSDVYGTLTDAQKAEAIKIAYEYATHVASEDVTGGKYESPKFVELAQEAKKNLGLTEAEYLLLRGVYRESIDGIEGDKNWKGKPVPDSKKKKILSAIDALDISDSEKDALYLMAGYAEKELWKAPWN